MSGIDIHKDIVEELAFDPSIHEQTISVAVREGVVTLSGSVRTYTEKLAVETAVKRISGVQAIVEELQIDLREFHVRSDSDLAMSAIDVIRWNATIPMGSITVRIEQGWATLTGSVDWQYQRETARIAVASIAGILGVTNSIKLNTRAVVGDVHAKIRDSFRRNAEIDAGRVIIKSFGGKVTLSGPVHSWKERDDAEMVAYSVSGVVDVENLTIVS